MPVDLKAEEEVRTTDLSIPTKPSYKRTPVKITLPKVIGPNSHARIVSRDKKIDLMVPATIVMPRFRPLEREVYFNLRVKSTVGAIEIDDRIPTPKEPW